jgi:hypothetical protein
VKIAEAKFQQEKIDYLPSATAASKVIDVYFHVVSSGTTLATGYVPYDTKFMLTPSTFFSHIFFLTGTPRSPARLRSSTTPTPPLVGHSSSSTLAGPPTPPGSPALDLTPPRRLP